MRINQEKGQGNILGEITWTEASRDKHPDIIIQFIFL